MEDRQRPPPSGAALAVAIEIKASATVAAGDLGGLRSLRDDLSERFRLGVVAYLGDTPEVVDRSLCVVPIASLLGAGA